MREKKSEIPTWNDDISKKKTKLVLEKVGKVSSYLCNVPARKLPHGKGINTC